MLGLGLALTNFGSRGGVADIADGVSSAALLLAAYGPYGVVMDYTDASIAIVDSTHALDFSSKGDVSSGALVGPAAKLTYAAPSPKLLEQADGVQRYNSHNLYLNNTVPANQSITVVSGASYKIRVTGTVSIALSGATSGTVTAGSPVSFTAATATLTCGSTSGSGRVYLYRTPCNEDGVDTAGTTLYAHPYRWSGGVRQGLEIEPQATNLFLNNTTGATQSITVTAQAYTLSFYGTGTITLSGASTAGPLVGSGASTRVSLTFTPSAGTLTCTVSGSCADVQLEAGPIATSVIQTYGSAVVRAADVLSLITSLFPYDGTLGTLFVDVTFKDVTGVSRGLVSTNNSDGRQIVQFGNLVFSHDGTTQLNSGTITASRTRIALSYGGGTRSLSRNGTMDVTNGAFDGAFGGSGILYIGNTGGINILIGTIHRIGYFTTKASNAVLPTIGA